MQSFLTTTFKVFLATKLLTVFQTERHKLAPNSTLGNEDMSLVETAVDSPILWQSYNDITEQTSNKINRILQREYARGTSINSIRRKISTEIKDLTKNRLDKIIRTEANNMQNLSREKTFKDLDSEDTLYVMKGPKDNRTAPSTMEVYQRQGNGLPLEDLKDLIREVSMKYHPKTYSEQRPWQIHINGRSALSRVV